MEALRTLAVFEELGVVDLAERTRKILEKVEETNWICESVEIALFVTPTRVLQSKILKCIVAVF